MDFIGIFSVRPHAFTFMYFFLTICLLYWELNFFERKIKPKSGIKAVNGKNRDHKPGEPDRVAVERDRGRRSDSKTLEVLYEISQAVSGTRDIEALYRVIHQALDKLLSVDNFYIALHHEGRDSITFPYYKDEKDGNPGEIFNFSKTASLTGRVIAVKQPLIFYEQDLLDFARTLNQPIIGTPSKVWLGAPLVIRNRVFGAIAIQSYASEQAYVEKDLDLLNTMSQHIALALERKESESRLQDQQKLLETILESSPVGISLVENRVFKWVNTQLVAMLGYEDKSQLTDHSAAMIYPDEEAYLKAGRIIEREMGLRGRVDLDTSLVRRDGSRFMAHVSITGYREEETRGRTIVIIADISQLDLAHKERMEKEKLQGVLEMAGAVCHEINQPLQTIMGYMELFESPEIVTPKALAQIRSQANRISDITRQLTRITRYKTKSYPGNATIMDIWGASN